MLSKGKPFYLWVGEGRREESHIVIAQLFQAGGGTGNAHVNTFVGGKERIVSCALHQTQQEVAVTYVDLCIVCKSQSKRTITTAKSRFDL